MRAGWGRRGLAALATGLLLGMMQWSVPSSWAEDGTAPDPAPSAESAARAETPTPEPAPKPEPETAASPEAAPEPEPESAAVPEPETGAVTKPDPARTAGEHDTPVAAPVDVPAQEPAEPVAADAPVLDEPVPQPTEPDPTTPEGEPVVVGGNLRWGLKESFRRYILGPIAHGSITLTPPAATEGATISYPASSGSWPSEVRTAGAVRYHGHDGELDLTLSNLRLRVGGTALLVVDARSSDGVDHPGLELASIDLTSAVTTTDDTVTIAGARTWLTTAGAAVFAYNGSPMYPAGTELDPLNATLQVEGGEPVIPTTPPEPVPTPEPTPTPKPTPAPSKPAPTGKVTKAGSLVWGVKASFRSYVTGPIAKGAISVTGARTSGSAYRFGQVSTTADLPDPAGSTRYRGKVRFTGHHGELDLTFGDPVVRITSRSAAVLSMSISGHGRVELATLDLSAASRSTSRGAVTFRGAPATLTSAGSKVFAYQGSTFYPKGTRLDPVTFTIGKKAAATSGATKLVATAKAAAWRPPAKAPATSGLTMTGDPVPGGEIVASGSGFRPGEPGIRVVLYSTPAVLAEVTADAEGVATWSGRLPAGIAPGAHTLTFQGTVDRGIRLEVAAPEPLVGCAVTEAELSWGFKESFRAYVSGSIANGDWSTSGNASYQTPLFTWSGGEGVRAADGQGQLGFTGGIRFTGHSGALDTSIANPVVRFAGGSAVLVVDYSGTSMDDALAGRENREELAGVSFVDLDLARGVTTIDGDLVTISDIPSSLTEAGSAAFPNYPAGTAFDPVTLSYRADRGCVAGEQGPTEPAEPVAEPSQAPSGAAEVSPVPVPPAEPGQPGWLAWVGGGAIGAVVAAGAIALALRRRGGVG